MKLAFDENGTTINETPGDNTQASAMALGVLPGLAVPNTAPVGSPLYGQTFASRY